METFILFFFRSRINRKMSNQSVCFLARFAQKDRPRERFHVSSLLNSLHFRICEFSRWESREKVSLKSYQRHTAVDKTFTETPSSPATSSPQTLNQTRNIAEGFGTTVSLLRSEFARSKRNQNAERQRNANVSRFHDHHITRSLFYCILTQK